MGSNVSRRFYSDGEERLFRIGQLFYNRLSADKVIEEGFVRNADFYRVISNLSLVSAQTERYVIDKDTKSQKLPKNKNIQVLESRPNKRESGMLFRKKIEECLRASGEVFIFGIKPVGGKNFTRFVCPTPGAVSIDAGKLESDETQYQCSYYGQNYDTRNEGVECLHIHFPDIGQDSENGLGALVPGELIYTTNTAVRENEYFGHKNKGVNGFLYTKGAKRAQQNGISDPRKALQSKLDKETQGKNTGKVHLLEMEAGYINTAVPLKDMNAKEAKEEHLRSAAALFGTVSVLYGDTAALTYDNFNTATKFEMLRAILPLSRIIDQELTRWLMPEAEGYEYCVNESVINVLNENRSELSTRVIQEYQAGLITQDEGRLMLHPDLAPLGENELRD
ncbi:MAG: phage portal protein [Bacteroidota bacterium]